MITAVTIGSNGRLGNQMFQYAALHGIAKFHNFEYWGSNGRLFEVFKMNEKENLPPKFLPSIRINEEKFEFDNRYFTSIIDNVDLFGYFQSEKYWKHCKADIIKLFQVKQSSNYFSNFSSECFLHVRRTDYLNLPDYHKNLENSYYKEAIKVLGTKSVIIFSDDANWCKENYKYFVPNTVNIRFACDICKSDIDELDLMMNCGSAIIANSTFSWWGAYLGAYQRGGNVIAPKDWFGKLGPNSQDIYPDGWTKI